MTRRFIFSVEDRPTTLIRASAIRARQYTDFGQIVMQSGLSYQEVKDFFDQYLYRYFGITITKVDTDSETTTVSYSPKLSGERFDLLRKFFNELPYTPESLMWKWDQTIREAP